MTPIKSFALDDASAALRPPYASMVLPGFDGNADLAYAGNRGGYRSGGFDLLCAVVLLSLFSLGLMGCDVLGLAAHPASRSATVRQHAQR